MQKQADEHEDALQEFPQGEEGESSFRAFVKVCPQNSPNTSLFPLVGCLLVVFAAPGQQVTPVGQPSRLP